ncbi:hypothetical protein FRX31_024612 [Thalictrum thalictroides]|uniref:Uncharacterized protein n=1 Tax=Thalictrum thalictroides TaxID=46969 RepID=A0A7J6VN73_THATH|nr:hypothetical protein FRX31_024612 [Thalictrum thalictroides]
MSPACTNFGKWSIKAKKPREAGQNAALLILDFSATSSIFPGHKCISYNDVNGTEEDRQPPKLMQLKQASCLPQTSQNHLNQ